MTEQFILILTFILLLALDLANVAARTALQASSLAHLLAMRDELGEVQVNKVIKIIQRLPRMLASLSMLLIITRFMLAGLVLYLINHQLPGLPIWGIGLGLFAAALLLFLLEFGVEHRIRHAPERSAVGLSGFATSVALVCGPLLALPLALAKGTQGYVEPFASVTEDELRNMVAASQEEGVIEQGERRMIYSIFELGDTLARELMVPRIDIMALEVSATHNQAIEIFIRSGHSRVPVYEDAIDNLLGVLYAKDLLRVWQEGGQLDSLRSLLRPAYFVPEAKKVDELMVEMQSQRIHMAVVVDEYGGIAGLLTLEDIIEEIFGEIQDEYDQAEELPYQAFQDGSYIFQGRIDLDDLNEIMTSNLVKDEADTLGGYIYSRLGHVPVAGETVIEGNLKLTVEYVSRRRIRKVRVSWEKLDGDSVKEEKHAD